MHNEDAVGYTKPTVQLRGGQLPQKEALASETASKATAEINALRDVAQVHLRTIEAARLQAIAAIPMLERTLSLASESSRESANKIQESYTKIQDRIYRIEWAIDSLEESILRQYIIKPGDTWETIAKAHSVSTEALRASNRRLFATNLEIDQKINLPRNAIIPESGLNTTK